jgi:hypothetical protein
MQATYSVAVCPKAKRNKQLTGKMLHGTAEENNEGISYHNSCLLCHILFGIFFYYNTINVTWIKGTLQ